MANILSIAGNPTAPSKTYGFVQYLNELLEKEGFHTDTVPYTPPTLSTDLRL